jgi:hypothetical protein
MGEHVIMERVQASKTRGNALGVACALALLAGSSIPAAAAIDLAATEQGVIQVGSARSDEQRMRTLDVEMGRPSSSTPTSRCAGCPSAIQRRST